MINRIETIRVFNSRLDPAEAEVWVSVHPERLTSVTQARGRLVGPRCPYATTVEVAYPLREQSREYESTGTPRVILRALIPEPSLWDPQSPFLYQGLLELWQGNERCDQTRFTHALRTLTLGPRGLRCNGRPLPLRGLALSGCSEGDARSYHQAGYNTLLVSAGADTAVWDLADRFGFLVLTRITDRAELEAETQRAEVFGKHLCCLGWVVTPEAVEEELARRPKLARIVPVDRELVRIVTEAVLGPFHDRLLGMELNQPPAGPLPAKVSFLVAEEHLLPQLAGIDLPKLVLRRKGSIGVAEPNVLGWIDSP